LYISHVSYITKLGSVARPPKGGGFNP
jgi:hypothetical protein